MEDENQLEFTVTAAYQGGAHFHCGTPIRLYPAMGVFGWVSAETLRNLAMQIEAALQDRDPAERISALVAEEQERFGSQQEAQVKGGDQR